MSQFRIKVCGMTRPQDVKTAIKLGADMIGLIFYRKSPRFVSRNQAKRLVTLIPPLIHRVGVFVHEQPDKILETAQTLKLGFVQLHGSKPSDVARIQREGFKVVQVISVLRARDIQRAKRSRADMVLLDNKMGDKVGGTGQTFDWRLVGKNRIPNMILAGGLNAANLREAIERIRPVVVDVNSGVESAPGVKSAKKLRTFFHIADEIRYG